MKRFTLLYPIFMALFFFFLYLPTSSFSILLNHFQTDITAWGVSHLLPPKLMSGHQIIISPHYSLIIEQACNAMIAILLFLASIWAYPSSLKRKILFSFIGYTSLTLINILRIYLVALIVLKDKNNFSLAHDFMGNIILLIGGILLFGVFVREKG
ncbi:MAG: archaeosortase/exosortase family protein [Epsilonproteobacteria bacterium]|nr:archaeosortase/exosortase family protein [Campylobacterota bacterium]MBD3838955.1 archaeosortase/exosortase family protein [Campylobacterota bacterium]